MNYTQTFIVLAVLVFACVRCQSSNDLDINDIEKTLHENGVPESFNVNATEQVENAFRKKCQDNGAEGVVDSLKEQQELLKECVTQHVNVTVLQEELEVSKLTGSMDEVFGKYCRKWPDVYKCVENVTDQVRLCMSDEEKVSFNKTLDIVSQLQEFMCFKDGDRLAMFVAEKGVECVTEMQEEVKQCINGTIGDRMPTLNGDQLSATSLPLLLFSERDCDDFDTIRICVNKELEKCNDSTPANIVDAFFKFLKKQMPCKSNAKSINGTAPTAAQSTSGSTIVTCSNIVLLGVLYSFVKFW